MITSNTKLYCIFGNPVEHSLSPIIHNACFKKHSIDAKYIAFQTQNIQSAIEAMRSLNILGASITLPFKTQVLQYVDELDEFSNKSGAANTLKNQNGKIFAYNTDGLGSLNSIRESGIDLNSSNILIIGYGGSCKSILSSLLEFSENIWITGRNIDKAKSIVKENINFIELDKLQDTINNFNLIINTTPIGMTPNTNLIPIPENLILSSHTVFDIVYSPHTTKLLDIAQKKGCKIIRGIDMLVNQAILQFKIWTNGIVPEKEFILDEIRKYQHTEL